MTEKKPEPPETLYHYCGVEAFHGIISYKQLFLSSALLTNDYMEYKWLFEKAKTRIAEVAESCPNRNGLLKFRDYLGIASPPYIFCFSAGRDMLSQWRGYSHDGVGFSIGYSFERIQELARIRGNAFEVSLQSASYDEDEQQAFVNELVDSVANGRDDWDGWALSEVLKLSSRAAVCKNAGFKEEMEWRIVFNSFRLSEENEAGWKTVASHLEHGPSQRFFRPTNGRIAPFYTLTFSPEAITEIYLGPKNHARDDHDFLKMFLSENGYDVDHIKIINSAATYR